MELMEKPSLVVHPHALVGDGRVAVVESFLERETLGAYIKRTGVIVPAGPVAVWHNGHRVPDALWRRLIPRPGDQVIIRARVLGGGGGSKILRTVAMIALVIAAPYVAPALGLAAGSLGASLVTAGIMIGGTLLINALLPPPTATAAQLGQGAKYESSPTYAISGGRNRMRPWEPMTLIFGRHKVVPDLGANYYTEYVGDDQYLNQVFHFGLQAGYVSLSDLRIGNTPITNYQGVRTQVSAFNGKLSMFPGNVDTIQGMVLDSGVVNSRTTGLDVTSISVELVAQLFRINDNGSIARRTVDVRLQYRPVGGAWVEVGAIGAVYATHYWSLRDMGSVPLGDPASRPQIEFGSTNKADHTEGETTLKSDGQGGLIWCKWTWTPHPYSLGQPWVGVAPNPVLSAATPGIRLSGARQEPTRRTITWNVAKGQYEVRAWKVTANIKNSRESNETAIGQILARQTDEADYTGQQRLALRIKATSQLNGAVDEFNAIASAKCRVWDGSAWVWDYSSNPAYWFYWFAVGRTDPETGNRVYGAGLTNAQIDLEAIKAWALWCDQRSLTFNYVLDRKISTAAVLQMIARAGRASPTWQTGKLGVVWDAANQPVVAMFGPFNIRAGTFKVDYINDDTADEIILNFTNPARNWGMDEVRVRVPGAMTTNNPLQLDFDGCTNVAMAGKEANLLAASQVWHRRRISWETDIEGWVAGRGDVVQFSHDLLVWGYSGRLISRDGNVLTLDKQVPSDGSGTVMIRGPENQMKVVSVTSEVGDVNMLTITSDMTGFPLPGDAGYENVPDLDWAWFFDPLSTPGRRFKITSVQPSEDGVKFSAIDDDAGYYASETNPYQYTPPRDGALLSGVVFGLSFGETLVNVQADITNVQISWTISVAMPVQVVVSVNDIAQMAVTTNERNITVQAQTGDIVRVTVTPKPATGGSGTPATQEYVVQGLTAPLPALTGLTNVFRDGLTILAWNRVVDIRQPEYEVRMGETWGNSRTVAITPMLESLAVGNGLYWVAARFATKGTVVYGPADSLLISGATLVRNVLLTQDEAPGWSGTVSGGAYIHDGKLTLGPQGDFLSIPDVFEEQDILWYGGPAESGIYTNAVEDQVDIGYITPVRVDFDIEIEARNVTADILGAPDIFAIEDILNGSDLQFVTATPQIRHAQEAGVWTEWRDYTPGLINARYFDVRVVLETSDPLIIPFVTKFEWTVDVPDLIQQATEITVPSGGLQVDYPKSFHTDSASPQITIFDAVDGDWAKLTDTDRAGFFVEIFNGITPKVGVINWITQAY